jgi:hypothetical protein
LRGGGLHFQAGQVILDLRGRALNQGSGWERGLGYGRKGL